MQHVSQQSYGTVTPSGCPAVTRVLRHGDSSLNVREPSLVAPGSRPPTPAPARVLAGETQPAGAAVSGSTAGRSGRLGKYSRPERPAREVQPARAAGSGSTAGPSGRLGKYSRPERPAR